MARRFGLPRINDIRVRNKLLLIYILCVVAPVLVTDLVFAGRIIGSVRQEALSQYGAITEAAQLNVNSELEDIIYLSTLIYTDNSFNTALDRDYTGVGEKYDTYVYFKDYLSRIRSMYSQVESVHIYTDNNTIPLSSDYIHSPENLRELDWYPMLRQAGDKVLFYTEETDGRKHVSVIRCLNYFHNQRHEKVVKIDLAARSISRHLKGGPGRWHMHLVNGAGQVVASSVDSANNAAGFVPLAELPAEKNDVVLTRGFEKYDVLRGWKIVAVFRPVELDRVLRQSWRFVLVMLLVNLLAATAVIVLISRSLNKRLKVISGHIRRHDLQALDVDEGRDEIGEIIREYNSMAGRIQSMIKNEYEYSIDRKNLELERKQAVINALESQINPHFLFNTLESIRMRSSLKNEEETAGIIRSLSAIFRRMLSWSDTVPVREELRFVEDYLKLQRYRFGPKIDYRIHMDPAVESLPIPKMTIQPFVENACIHGLESITGNGVITVRVEMLVNTLSVVILDNGRGMDSDRLEQVRGQAAAGPGGDGSIGIRNVCNRLRLLYGGRFRFDIKSQPGEGTGVSIEIDNPQEQEGNGTNGT